MIDEHDRIVGMYLRVMAADRRPSAGIKINISHTAFDRCVDEIQAAPIHGCARCVGESNVLPFRSLSKQAAVYGNCDSRVEK